MVPRWNYTDRGFLLQWPFSNCYSQGMTRGFKALLLLWWAFLLAIVLTAFFKKPEGPHRGDPFDVNNPYRP